MNWVENKKPEVPTTPAQPVEHEPTIEPTTKTTTQPPTITFDGTGEDLSIWDTVRIYLYKMKKEADKVIVEGSTTGMVGTDNYYYDLEVNFLDATDKVLFTAPKQTFRVGAHKTAVFEYIYETAEPDNVKSFQFIAYKIKQPTGMA